MKSHPLIALLTLAALGSVSRAGAAPSTPSPAGSRPPVTSPFSSGATPLSPAPNDMIEYLNRQSQFKDDDIEPRLALARWARDRQMWPQAQEMADQVLYRDPGNRAAYLVLQQVDEARPLPPEPDNEKALTEEMLLRFKHDFKTRNTKHFLVAYDTTEPYALQRGVAMEKAYDAFQFYFNMSKLRPDFLDRRLVMILLKDREDYLAYGIQMEKNDLSWSGGFYSQRTNRSIFFDEASATSNASFAKQTVTCKAQVDTLDTQIRDAARTGQTGLVNQLTLERNNINEYLVRLRDRASSNAQVQNNATTMHEAAHQISFNMGIQNRGIDYPFWFSEGLACCFEVEDSAGHRGPALVNFGRVPSLKEALKNDKLLPLDEIVTTNPDPAKQDAALAYAESWALFHYLYRFNRDGMEQYILAYKSHAPHRPIGADERKVLFTKAFGKELDDLNKKWTAYLRSLPAKPN